MRISLKVTFKIAGIVPFQTVAARQNERNVLQRTTACTMMHWPTTHELRESAMPTAHSNGHLIVAAISLVGVRHLSKACPAERTLLGLSDEDSIFVARRKSALLLVC